MLGILLMNILGFGLPKARLYDAHRPGRRQRGPCTLWAWFAEMFYLQGTMRGLFTVLFGAGVILSASRLERAGLSAWTWRTTIFRRNIWLFHFRPVQRLDPALGSGDILFDYGLAALFLFVFCKLPVRKLLLWAACS